MPALVCRKIYIWPCLAFDSRGSFMNDDSACRVRYRCDIRVYTTTVYLARDCQTAKDFPSRRCFVTRVPVGEIGHAHGITLEVSYSTCSGKVFFSDLVQHCNYKVVAIVVFGKRRVLLLLLPTLTLVWTYIDRYLRCETPKKKIDRLLGRPSSKVI
jgi:hypothetical protein